MGFNCPSRRVVVAGLALMGAMGAVAPASGEVGMIGGSRNVWVDNPTGDEYRHVYLVERGIAEPAAMVDRDLGEQPVHTYLAEMSIAHMRVLFDPTLNYQVKAEGELDSNHSLLATQRLYLSRRAGTQTLRARPAEETQVAAIRPLMIMTKPAVPAVPRFVPETPAPQKANPRLIAAK